MCVEGGGVRGGRQTGFASPWRRRRRAGSKASVGEAKLSHASPSPTVSKTRGKLSFPIRGESDPQRASIASAFNTPHSFRSCLGLNRSSIVLVVKGPFLPRDPAHNQPRPRNARGEPGLTCLRTCRADAPPEDQR